VQGEQAPLTQPAEEPGSRNRWMVTLDRIRLTGLLPKSPARRGFSMWTAARGATRARVSRKSSPQRSAWVCL